MASSIASKGDLSVYIFCNQTEDGWRVSKVKYFKNGQEEGRFMSSASIIATDRAKTEFEAYLKDPDVTEEGQTYLDLLSEAQRKFEDQQRELS